MKILPGYYLTGLLKAQHGIRAQVIELDEDYAPVSKRFILKTFTPYFRNRLANDDLLAPALQSNDCDDFVFRAMFDARRLHHLTYPGKSSIAFGALQYYIGGLGGPRHWINFGVNWKDVEPVKLDLFFYDAVERREAFLTQQEHNTLDTEFV
jgi:hypothetical protein